MNLRHVTATGVLLSATLLSGSGEQPKYQVLDGITDHNMTVFPILSSRSYNTDDFLTLDEGIKTGQVIVTEAGSGSRMVRPTPQDGGGWSERPIWPVGPDMAQVNELRIINRSDRPLILLAGEIVTGGKQDRIVGKDRIVPAHSDPVSLDVFCVEPHRWAGASSRFHSMAFTMAQPSIRTKAAGEQDQTAVWDEVAHARRALAIPAESDSSSSYAAAMTELSVQSELNSFASDKLQQELQAKRAVGAVIAINKRLVWADVFASSDLFAKYWPKLLRLTRPRHLRRACIQQLNVLAFPGKMPSSFSITCRWTSRVHPPIQVCIGVSRSPDRTSALPN